VAILGRGTRASQRSLTRAGTEGRAGGERAGAHAEARAQRRGNVTQKIAAAGAAAVNSKRSGGVGAEPVTAGFAKRIDTLHREAGQILHFSPQNLLAQIHLKRGHRAAAGLKVLSSPSVTKHSAKKARNIPRKNASAGERDGGDCAASGL
jgi:hypothetical protein